MNIIVLKFGGTSVANNEKLNLVSKKITTLYDEGYDVVVVVSAQGKKTDSLLNEAYKITNIPNNRELDTLLSIGEQESMSKLSILLNKNGYNAISLTGWQAGIYTSNNYQNATINHIDTSRIIAELSKGKIVVVAGFQGINEQNDITTLGRGGSDTTAVSIAAALGAKKCYIYSDVEGVFTSDPRKIEDTIKLNNLSYDEMLDISNEGAKVLHNRCVEVAKKFDIPIVAKSTFTQDAGTEINNIIESKKVKSLVKNDDLLLVCIPNNNFTFVNLYKNFIDENIMPVEFIDVTGELRILFKSTDSKKINHILQQKVDSKYVSAVPISRISIIGYGITSDTKILKEVANILDDISDKIHKIDINNGKVRITFKEIVSNDILKKLHSKLI